MPKDKPESKRMPWFSFYAGDYLSDPAQQSMNLVECGIYNRMLALMWKHNQSKTKWEGLPFEDPRIRKMVGATPRQYKGFVDRYVGGGLPIHRMRNDAFTSARLEKEFIKARAKVEEQAERRSGKGKGDPDSKSEHHDHTPNNTDEPDRGSDLSAQKDSGQVEPRLPSGSTEPHDRINPPQAHSEVQVPTHEPSPLLPVRTSADVAMPTTDAPWYRDYQRFEELVWQPIAEFWLKPVLGDPISAFDALQTNERLREHSPETIVETVRNIRQHFVDTNWPKHKWSFIWRIFSKDKADWWERHLPEVVALAPDKAPRPLTRKEPRTGPGRLLAAARDMEDSK